MLHQPPTNERQVKLCLLGDVAVGKTSTVLRFVTRCFDPSTVSTVGASFMATTVKSTYGEAIKLNIWDTAGQEKYRGLAPMYFRGAESIILVYDITNRKSFKALDVWLEELETNELTNTLIAIVGNKVDLEAQRDVTTLEGHSYAAKLPNSIFLETSAKSGTNVELLFNEIVNKLPAAVTGSSAATDEIVDLRPPVTSIADPSSSTKGCC